MRPRAHADIDLQGAGQLGDVVDIDGLAGTWRAALSWAEARARRRGCELVAGRAACGTDDVSGGAAILDAGFDPSCEFQDPRRRRGWPPLLEVEAAEESAPLSR